MDIRFGVLSLLWKMEIMRRRGCKDVEVHWRCISHDRPIEDRRLRRMGGQRLSVPVRKLKKNRRQFLGWEMRRKSSFMMYVVLVLGQLPPIDDGGVIIG